MKFLVVCSNFGDFLYCFFPLANVNVIIQRKKFSSGSVASFTCWSHLNLNKRLLNKLKEIILHLKADAYDDLTDYFFSASCFHR